MSNRRRGFTFFEMLIVMIILGILAALALPRFGALNNKARLASMRSDVRNAQSAEETYYADYGTYGTLGQLQAAGTFSVSAGNTMTVTVGASGFRVEATNGAISLGPTICTVQIGMGAAPAVDGKLSCM